ncbi:MAG: tRNA (adenosine(37)-N6)-threonylcarbamoyltransferase complex dimerization subunit type 1 TsaB [Planctomycetota bacterium]|jgi:tRNA threonylcarbamoyladenosine biosynthesis protein TsaB
MLLAIEMSGGRNTLALHDGSRCSRIDFSDQRGKGLMPAVAALLERAEIDRSEILGILVGTGPGSYTGLRIACSAGIMLGFALDIPCGGICSFAAAAFTADLQDRDLHLVLDAYRKEAYHACYRTTAEGLQVLVAPQVLPLREVASSIGNHAFLGDPALAPDGQCHSRDCQPEAEDLVRFALASGIRADGSGIDSLDPVEPMYLRPAAFRRTTP